MVDFIDRQEEINDLNSLLEEDEGQFAIVYGRRRVGKTTLLKCWVSQTNVPTVYWIARRESPAAVRYSMARAFWRGMGRRDAPRFDNWETQFEEMALLVGDQPLIIIFDEFPYAVESDSSLPSHLQAVWDHLFQDKPVILVLAGSHIGMMVDLLGYQAPLYGRFTAQLPLGPLPYAALIDFYPNYTAAERVAVYAVLGGIPGYLKRFKRTESVGSNIKRQLMRKVGLFRSEPTVLISDLVREPKNYASILKAIAQGKHTLSKIALEVNLSTTHVPPYLKRLIELHLIERRIPATVPPKQRQTSKRGRYHLRDPYLRFYYRFIEPELETIEFGEVDLLWQQMKEQFRAFIGMTTWEELSREWLILQANRGQLPFPVALVGSHWAKDAQVDVVAINWREKAILLGECKWGDHTVGRSVIRELIGKTSRVIPEPDWQVHYAFFARKGFTEAARAEAGTVNALLVDLERLEDDLRQAMLNPLIS
ncbi:MAG: hypothetical protein GY805_16595 [Chloroflexi bacterium]|nr:hypothetical protein [Chloroflexota bacterium]